MADKIKVHCSHTELVDVIKLVEHPSNPNQHDDRQINLLARIIKAQGWRNPITVSKRSGYIVAGHGRLAAAKVLNEEKVPVDYQDFDNDADETAHLLADNRVAELSELDYQSVGELLKELQGNDFELELTGFLQHEIDPLLEADWTPPEIEEMDNSITSGHTVKFTDENWNVITDVIVSSAEKLGIKKVKSTATDPEMYNEQEVITAICKAYGQM
jgi:hypothetical protein